MKTQIIQLEAHDDVISTRDKMGSSRANRILLVWPPKTSILNRRLDLLLLLRHSSFLGIQLGLVTHNDEVRFHASQLGIPTFTTPRQAQIDRWRTVRRWRKPTRSDREQPGLSELYMAAHPPSPRWLEHPAVRLASFGASLAAFLALAVFLLPGAQITVEPNVTEQRLSLSVHANPDLEKPLLTGEVPVAWTTVIVEGRDSLPASGTALAPEKPALGSVVFSNLTEEAVEIPAGTVVTTLDTPPARFLTTRDARVSAGIGQRATVPVQAATPGSSGNLEAGKLQAIEGALGLSLSVNNPQSTLQGSDQPVPSPTNQDRQLLLKRLQAALELTARSEAESQLPQHASLPPGESITDYPLLPTLRLRQVLEETYLPAEGMPGDTLNLILRLEFEYQVVAATDLQALALPILAAGIAPGYQPVPGSLRIDHHTPAGVGPDGNMNWEITVHQKVQSQVNTEQVSQLARGLRVSLAQTRLQREMDLAQVPVIRVSPAWWPYLPYLPFRIEITVQPENG